MMPPRNPGRVLPRRRDRAIYPESNRGSALIIVLAMLAMLAVMATSFMMLMRLDTRIARNYVDDQRCELMAYGVINYFKAVLREDLDRTWGRYENRDTGTGFYSRVYKGGGDPDFVRRQIPGVVENAWGTPASNDFWFSAPWATWGQSGGDIYGYPSTGYYGVTQQSFAWNDKYGQAYGFVGRYRESSGYECDAWIGLSANCWDPTGRIVAENYVGGGALTPIDDDMDGVANAEYIYGSGTAFARENAVMYDNLYDQVPFVMQAGPTGYQPSEKLTRERALPGGLWWRWGVKIGPTHSSYANINVHGNLDGADSQWLSNMGGLAGVKARRSVDEASDTWDSGNNSHLGRIEWQGFPDFYDAVMYHPASVNLERLFHRSSYSGYTNSPTLVNDLGLDRALARDLIRYRCGNINGRPGGGDNRRVGWRRDGASFFKFPSPENPLGDDRYFGANEVIEHDHTTDNPTTSAVARILGDDPWRKLRAHVTMWSTDTILRGKIFPTEGPPYTASQGNWRHIDILKRVNINIIGASGPEGLTGEDSPLKTRWAAKRLAEMNRLYYMLKGGMNFAGISGESQKACQFIASLSDMVDRDNEETCYVAPDGSGAFGLGVEKHPVINEISCAISAGANTSNYTLFRFRMELYNPAENIPWIPDADEACEIKDYIVRLGSVDFLVGDLSRFSARGLNDDMGAGAQIKNIADDKKRKIGADGMYGVPIPGYPTGETDPVWGDPTWTRYYHLGWKAASVSDGNWPNGLTRAILEGPSQSGIAISLWKPVDNAVPLAAGKVEDIGGRRYLCVDTTGTIRLIQPYGPGSVNPTYSGPGGAQAAFLGAYRRWDPMNARIFDGGNYGKVDSGNVIWCPGWLMASYSTLGRPNIEYKAGAYTTPGSSTVYSNGYRRTYERNFKVVDGDLPSIGWLGELMMVNRATAGPLTMVHTSGQNPTSAFASQSQLDTLAKFDLYRPFVPAGQYSPDTSNTSLVNPKGLHILDCFTVWDPSNDGIDNDGDGAVDDQDTGLQAGDKGGPEIRLFGLLDLNQISAEVWATVWPDNKVVRQANKAGYPLSFAVMMRQTQRESSYAEGIGPFETIGDLLRADHINRYPGLWLGGEWWGPGPGALSEVGFVKFNQYTTPYPGDDDGDGIYDERDERDMMFTWMANHFTTRDNVFEIDVNAQLCEPPYYPTRGGAQVLLPFKAYKSARGYARKQVLGILDRSTCLRVKPDRTCDFTGPVQVRMLRATDDVQVY